MVFLFVCKCRRILKTRKIYRSRDITTQIAFKVDDSTLCKLQMSFITIHFGGKLKIPYTTGKACFEIYNYGGNVLLAFFADDQKLLFNLFCPSIILYENIKLRCGCDAQGELISIISLSLTEAQIIKSLKLLMIYCIKLPQVSKLIFKSVFNIFLASCG